MSGLPKMKPCPLCGHDEHLDVYTYDGGGTHVECSTTCGYLGPACTGVRWAIRHHNERRDETARQHIASLVARSTAAEAERDAWRSRESETQEALQKIGEEFGVLGGEPRVDGIRRVLTKMRAGLDAIADAYTAHGYSDAMDAVQNLKDIAKDARK